MSNLIRERISIQRAGGCTPNRATCRYNVVKQTWAPGAWDKPPVATVVIEPGLSLKDAKDFVADYKASK